VLHDAAVISVDARHRRLTAYAEDLISAIASRDESFGPIARERPVVDASPVPFCTPVDRVVPPAQVPGCERDRAPLRHEATQCRRQLVLKFRVR
jgi:hypothetical protein